MKYGLYLTLTRLYVLKLWLECSGACLKFVNNFGSYLQKTGPSLTSEQSPFAAVDTD